MEEDMAIVKTQTAEIIKRMDRWEKQIVWKDTCDERHKGVDAKISTVKKKTCKNEKELDDHKKEDKDDSKYTITTAIAIIAIILTLLGLGYTAFVVGG